MIYVLNFCILIVAALLGYALGDTEQLHGLKEDCKMIHMHRAESTIYKCEELK